MSPSTSGSVGAVSPRCASAAVAWCWASTSASDSRASPPSASGAPQT
ncbi:MAG: hypothetical protein JF625_24580 [Inquilinus limosus]|uniref:Uncharacterized protein n=1 Tax=Inquilinus limosus TaxID=171674 RepID=A0A952FNF2_9PROT|nr:hypothetical protein [Inquilinus limosus]